MAAGFHPEPTHRSPPSKVRVTSEPQLLPEPQSASSPWAFHQAILLQNRSRSHMVAASRFVPSDGQSALGRKAQCCRVVLIRVETLPALTYTLSHL